jgi:hypothetical protein
MRRIVTAKALFCQYLGLGSVQIDVYILLKLMAQDIIAEVTKVPFRERNGD